MGTLGAPTSPSASETQATYSYTWETSRNVLDTKKNGVGSTVISQYGYTVNAIGQRTNVTTNGTAFPATPSWAWGYDTLGKIISADSSTDTFDRPYQYDAIGNRKKYAYSLNLPGSDNYISNPITHNPASQFLPRNYIVRHVHSVHFPLNNPSIPYETALLSLAHRAFRRARRRPRGGGRAGLV